MKKPRLTQQQKEVLQDLRDGRKLIHHPYTPGVHIPAHTFWEEDRSRFFGRKNYNIVMRALIKKGYVEKIHTSVCGEFGVVLTQAGWEVKL